MKKLIYQERIRISREYQPDHFKEVEKLKQVIEWENLDHSYDELNERCFGMLSTSSSDFKYGAHGRNAQVQDNKFLYRYVPLEKLAKEKFGWDDEVISIKNAFQELEENLQKSGKEWYPLANVMPDERYHNGRFFSWWTTTDLSSESNILRALFQLGLPADWIGENSVIMRFETKQLKEEAIRVPSTIDGYCSIVFLPANYAESPKHGTTLNLNNMGNFSNGLAEVVVSEIPTDFIEIKPVKIPQGFEERMEKWLEREYVNKEERTLIDKLYTFYKLK